MKIKSENGIVTFTMLTGKSKVRNKMSLKDVATIMSNTQDVVETPTEIIVDGKYFFPVEPEKKPRKKTTDEEVSNNE